mgnify:CR=1 FL=1
MDFLLFCSLAESNPDPKLETFYSIPLTYKTFALDSAYCSRLRMQR